MMLSDTNKNCISEMGTWIFRYGNWSRWWCDEGRLGPYSFIRKQKAQDSHHIDKQMTG